MMCYTFICPNCTEVQEVYLSVHEPHVLDCERCGLDMDRYWQADLPIIQGETVAGGHDVSGYDPMLGMHIRDRAHLNKVMEKKDLQFYEPSSSEAEISKEINYLRDNGARKNDKEVRELCEKSGKECQKLRMGDRHKKKIRKIAGEHLRKADI